MADVLSALALLFEPSTFIMCFVGMLVGVILGAIPGLAAGLAITVMLPISFHHEVHPAFALLMSIWVGGCSGSFRTGRSCAWVPPRRSRSTSARRRTNKNLETRHRARGIPQ